MSNRSLDGFPVVKVLLKMGEIEPGTLPHTKVNLK